MKGANGTAIQPCSIDDPFINLAYAYDGTLEGLLSAIFAAYERRENPTDVVRSANVQARLGQRIEEIETDPKRALRVQRGICRAGGRAAFDTVMHASLSDDPDAGTVVYRFVRHLMDERCTQKGRKAPVSAISDITHPDVEPLIKLARFVSGECHQMKQFIRFEQVEGGVWVARCAPKASVVPLLMDWFSARFNTQPFVIYDEAHAIAGVYEGKGWYLVHSEAFTTPESTENDVLMRKAWKRFYDTIAVESRYNPELRRQHMPKRFWKHLTEMQEEVGSLTKHP